jgi:NAD(P)-dependent dehydrogenase (short-subunit alcohol dehydrogenase family)
MNQRQGNAAVIETVDGIDARAGPVFTARHARYDTSLSPAGRCAMLPGIKQFDLTSKAAIVTGGSKGLGQAMAAGLASAGADVLLASRHREEAEKAANEIAADFGHRAIGVAADVADEAQVQAMVDRAIKEFGKVDILINNAGINIRGPIDELTYEQFRQVQQINVDGLWLASRAVVPKMKKQGSGRIINLASTLGVVGLENRTPYTASKGAVVTMTRALALELAPHNILVNAICPGPFLTPMNEPIADAEQTKKFIVGAVALARWGKMQEIQGAAIFLASDAASYVTGSLICVDGGWTAR